MNEFEELILKKIENIEKINREDHLLIFKKIEDLSDKNSWSLRDFSVLIMICTSLAGCLLGLYKIIK